MDYKEKYNFWLGSEFIDEETKNELRAIENDEKEIEDRFYKELEFGTGGIRGIIGAGTNRINKYVVRKATQGLANFILQQPEYSKEKGVAISYDCRHKSTEFAKESALVLNANGIKTYIFKELRPTPELSFAVRELNCISGIMLTASHNPPKYNGYKAYWADGCQVTSPKDVQIIEEVNKINNYSLIKIIDEEDARKQGLYNEILEEIDNRFIEELKKESLNMDIIKKVADDFNIVYTPFNGTGNKPMRRILEEIGFKNIYVVPEQENPDPNFTTLEYPNPEDPKAFKLALELAKEKNADIIIGADPDADRIGVVVKNKEGEYEILTGNMTGVLLTEYLLSERKNRGILPKNPTVIKTIVSTEMVRAVVKEYDAKLIDVLTGFKYIGEKMTEWEQTGEKSYIFGFEESYGCLAGMHARDKDSIVATMLACELAAVYKDKGMTLYEGLQDLYKKYGYYKETIVNINLAGKEGAEKIDRIMTTLRNNPIKNIGEVVVEKIKDYKKQTCFETVNEELKEYKELPTSNVLYYELEDNAWLCVRPSGTEPKIKIYMGAKGKSESDALAKIGELKKEFMLIVEKID